MTQHAAASTTRRVVFSVCLTISSALALPAWGQSLMSSYECNPAQVRSPFGSKCADENAKDLINKAPKVHVLYCRGSDLTCCLIDNTKPHGSLSDCKSGQMPPAPSGTASCKSIDENYQKAVQALAKTQQALKDITSKEQKIKATNDRKLIDAWKEEVKAESNDHDKAGKDVDKARSAYDGCNKDLFNTRK